MAEGLDGSSFGGFSISIENTASGNQQVIQDLFEPETSTSSPEEIQEIKEPEKKEPSKPQNKPKEQPKVEETKEEEEPNNITSFLEENNKEATETEDNKPNKNSNKEEPIEEGSEEQEESSVFETLAKDLFKVGIFTQDDEEAEFEVKTAEQFKERFNYESEKKANQKLSDFLEQFGPDYKESFKAIYVNGVDPKEYFTTYNSIQNFSEMDLSKESNQISVIKQALLDQGFEPEDTETEIERLKNYGDLEAVAAKHHKVLVKKEVQKLQQMEQEKQQELQQKAAFKQLYIKNVNTVLQEKLKTKEFDGIPLNTKLAQELQDFLITDRYQTSTGEKLTEFDKMILDLKRPENHAQKVKIALLLKMLEKDPTLSTIQKTGVTKQTNQLFSEVVKQKQKSAVKSSNTEKSTSWWQ